ncbi:hypothetical protein [Nocardia sp. NPDC046763]|uniref:hypothetical protein n=1 Tax=Nocardia sp. NPDC046763 TaxID=3155256 RepID=UPI0033F9561C
MSFEASLRSDLTRWIEAKAEMDVLVDRASMWALREAGRQVKREARKLAPVYGGTTKSVAIGSRRGFNVTTGPRNAEGKRGYKYVEGVQPGLLQSSISPSRRLKKRGEHDYRLSVGPRGGHVHLYSGKQEGRVGYMEAGRAAASGRFQTIFETAQRNVLRKYG